MKLWTAVLMGYLSIILPSFGGSLYPPREVEIRPTSLSDAYVVKNSSDLSRLRKSLGEDGFLLLQKINRRDSRHMKKGTQILLPQQPGDHLSYSPFPRFLNGFESVPKLLLVSLRVQAFGAYENGLLKLWGPTSTGTKKQATPASLYHTNYKSRRKRSTIDSSWIMNWYFNLHTSMGVAFHQYAMPGFPASYGCIRLLESDARWLYKWADEWVLPLTGQQPSGFGTPVIVFGEYDYEEPPPWTDSSESSAILQADEVKLALDKWEWIIKARAEQRVQQIQSAR